MVKGVIGLIDTIVECKFIPEKVKCCPPLGLIDTIVECKLWIYQPRSIRR